MVQLQFKKFQDLTNAELYNLLQLRVEVFCVEQNCPYQDLDGKDVHAIHVLLYEEDQQELVATCRLLPTGISYNDYCSIGRVCVKENKRSKKYGRELMKAAIEFCLQHYNAYIKISAQQYLQNFYSSMGFHAIGTMYLEDNIPHIAMIFKP